MGAAFRRVAGRAIGCAALAALSGCVSTSPPSVSRTAELDRIEADLLAHVEILAGDEFEGRMPGTAGEGKTLSYLAGAWEQAGLISATNDPANPWFAPVELIKRVPQSSAARFRKNRRVIAIPDDGVQLFTGGRRSLIESAPLLFVGKLGPTLDRSELTGRVAVMLWDHPDRTAQKEGLLNNGAAAVLGIIPDDSTFAVAAQQLEKGSYHLASDGDGTAIDGIISGSAANALIGTDALSRLTKQSADSAFTPIDLGIQARLEARSVPAEITTHNIIAKLPGNGTEDEAVLLMAHWDHFGVCGSDGEAPVICGGAVDNASGLAVISEVADLLGKGPALDRDVIFVATTAEEWGLLGAQAFTRNPPVPLSSIVAAFNMDTIGIAPRGSDVAIVGQGMTSIDGDAMTIVERAGRRVSAKEFANQFVKRQDGWALLQNDVPTLMISSAFARPDLMQDYTRNRYHKPADNIGSVELGGASEDVLLHVDLVRHFANTASYPVRAVK